MITEIQRGGEELNRLKHIWQRVLKRLGSDLRKSVAVDASRVLKEHRLHRSGRALFIDMGSNVGQGFEFFRQYYPQAVFDYWCFEPNPHSCRLLEERVSRISTTTDGIESVVVYEAAIGAQNGSVKLFGLVEDARGLTSDGASIVEEHNSRFYKADCERALIVRVIDSCDVLIDAAMKYQTIVVKMDIESAEYEVLEKVLSDDCLRYVDLIYVEWHAEYADPMGRPALLRRERSLKKKMGKKLRAWQ